MKPPLYKQAVKTDQVESTPKKVRVERPQWNKSAKKLGPLYSSCQSLPSLLTNMPRSRSSVAHAITNPETLVVDVSNDIKEVDRQKNIKIDTT